jgi:ribosome-associated toxin RatA of RatAB toxin-antitoxin module
VDAVEILEAGRDRIVARWDARIEEAPIRWVQSVHCNEAAREMDFAAEEGDFDVFRGKWSVIGSDDGVRLNLVIEYRLGIPVIEEVLGPILKEKVAANSTSMLEAIAAQIGHE